MTLFFNTFYFSQTNRMLLGHCCMYFCLYLFLWNIIIIEKKNAVIYFCPSDVRQICFAFNTFKMSTSRHNINRIGWYYTFCDLRYYTLWPWYYTFCDLIIPFAIHFSILNFCENDDRFQKSSSIKPFNPYLARYNRLQCLWSLKTTLPSNWLEKLFCHTPKYLF